MNYKKLLFWFYLGILIAALSLRIFVGILWYELLMYCSIPFVLIALYNFVKRNYNFQYSLSAIFGIITYVILINLSAAILVRGM